MIMSKIAHQPRPLLLDNSIEFLGKRTLQGRPSPKVKRQCSQQANDECLIYLPHVGRHELMIFGPALWGHLNDLLPGKFILIHYSHLRELLNRRECPGCLILLNEDINALNEEEISSLVDDNTRFVLLPQILLPGSSLSAFLRLPSLKKKVEFINTFEQLPRAAFNYALKVLANNPVFHDADAFGRIASLESGLVQSCESKTDPMSFIESNACELARPTFIQMNLNGKYLRNHGLWELILRIKEWKNDQVCRNLVLIHNLLSNDPHSLAMFPLGYITEFAAREPWAYRIATLKIARCGFKNDEEQLNELASTAISQLEEKTPPFVGGLRLPSLFLFHCGKEFLLQTLRVGCSLTLFENSFNDLFECYSHLPVDENSVHLLDFFSLLFHRFQAELEMKSCDQLQVNKLVNAITTPNNHAAGLVASRLLSTIISVKASEAVHALVSSPAWQTILKCLDPANDLPVLGAIVVLSECSVVDIEEVVESIFDCDVRHTMDLFVNLKYSHSLIQSNAACFLFHYVKDSKKRAESLLPAMAFDNGALYPHMHNHHLQRANMEWTLLFIWQMKILFPAHTEHFQKYQQIASKIVQTFPRNCRIFQLAENFLSEFVNCFLM